MEEVDSIILHSLHQLGVDLPSEVDNLFEFPPDLVVLAVSKCLQTILPGSDIPKVLSSGMSQKFQIASRLAFFCKELGYKGDMGYQTFLYPDENDLRRVFMFLIERLPKEFEKNEESQPTDDISLLIDKICKKIDSDLNQAWIPPYCKKKSLTLNEKGMWQNNGCSFVTSHGQPNFKPSKGSTDVLEEMIKYWDLNGQHKNFTKNDMTTVKIVNNLNNERINTIIEKITLWKKTNQEDTSNSIDNNILEINTRETMQNETYPKNSYNSNVMPAEESKNSRESSDNYVDKNHGDGKKLILLQLQQDLIMLKEDVYATEIDIGQLKKNIVKLNTLKLQRQSDMEVMVNNINLYKDSFSEIPITEDYIKIANKSIEESEQRMSNLIKEWDEHRVPLEIEIQVIEEQKSENQPLKIKKAKEIEKIIMKYEEVQHELLSKEKLQEELISEHTNLSKNVRSRSGYTRKIMEIIGNISKQKLEIEKILSDTRAMQKEINNLNGQLGRCFTLADEMIFKDVKKDEQSRKAYKLLATLHTICGEITTMVNDTGICLRDIRDLEEQVDVERTKNVQETLDKITYDLKQMQFEAQTLRLKIKEQMEIK